MRPNCGINRIGPMVRAYTLVELLISMSIATVLIAAIGSAVYVAGFAVPTRGSGMTATLETSNALEHINEELRYAEYIVTATSTGITFLVPDRNNDGQPERIGYSWSGVKDSPLWRSYNGSTPQVFVPSVQDFEIQLNETAYPQAYPGLPVEDGVESLLNAFEDGSTNQKIRVNYSNVIAQHLIARLPANGHGWRFTGIELKAQDVTLASTMLDPYREDINHLPTGSKLGTQVVTNSDTPSSMGWFRKDFSGMPALAKGEGLCLRLVTGLLGGHDFALHNSAPRGFLISDGAAWKYHADRTMLYRLYGRIIRTGANESYEVSRYRSVTLSLWETTNRTAGIQSNVMLMNTPQKLETFWKADFYANPALFDFNGDGILDWVTGDGNSLNGLDTATGIWRPQQTLQTKPNETFTGVLTLIDLTMRDASSAAGSATFSINAANSGASAVPLTLFVQKTAENRQEVALFNHQDVALELDLGIVMI
ncbi:MAG: PilW family protein, partial [Phycisphaerae bacterium]